MVTYLYHYNYLSEDAIIVAESDNENLLDPLEIIEHFAGFKKYKYGKTYVYIVRR
jgi:16S rRNA G966 N2-methylase RsmD